MSSEHYGAQAGEIADAGEPRTCPNCGEPLHPCSLGDDCGLYGWRHPDGAHECEPRRGGFLFTFPAELDPREADRMRQPRGNTGLRS